MKISVLGAGAWGTAMAIHLSQLGHSVTLVPRREDHAQALRSTRENSDYLPGIPLPKTLTIDAHLPSALQDAQLVIFGCPSKALRELASSVKAVLHNYKANGLAFITLSKGLEPDSFFPPVTVIEDVLPGAACGILSGPNFAHEVAQGLPAAATLAMNDACSNLPFLQEQLSNNKFRVYRSHDVRGVEYACCLKNVYAIGGGVCEGLRLGDNARAMYLTRALNEMIRIGTALGGESETLYGISGLGDLVLTCTGSASRNRTFGENLAKGHSVDELLANRITVVEGYWTTKCFHGMLQKKKIDSPILNELYLMLYRNKTPQAALESLMTRSLKAEVGH